MKQAKPKKRGRALRILGIAAAVIAVLVLGANVWLNTARHRELSGVRGVNLGSWLVLEHWMTPEVFAGTGAVDEYTLARIPDREDYEARIRTHRETFITEDDFRQMAQMGLNTIRIPIPYYLFGNRSGEPYIACVDELDQAFDWAEKWGLKILIDLHMVPGSQNGFDNGGTSGVCAWWRLPDEVAYTLDLLERLAERYGRRTGLFGIQPLNEPIVGDGDWMSMDIVQRYPPVDEELLAISKPIPPGWLKSFYLSAYQRIRPRLDEDKWVVFHDAFTMWDWVGFMPSGEYPGVAFDTHVYLFNSENVAHLSGPFWHDAFVWINGTLMRLLGTTHPVIVGEWSLFNHYAQGLPETQRAAYYTASAEKQLAAWDQYGAGGLFWNWRLGSGAQNSRNSSWELKTCYEQGWIDFSE